MRLPTKFNFKSAACLVALMVYGQASYACLGVQVSASDLNFSVYNTLSSGNESSSFDIEVECLFNIALPLTFPLSYNIGVDSSLLGGNGARQLKHQSLNYYLDYTLYSNSSLSQILGPITGLDLLSGQFLSINLNPIHSFISYGVITGGQNVPAGTYTDQLSITLEF